MLELYLSKVDETSESELAGKLYARVSYKQTLSVQDMAQHRCTRFLSPCVLPSKLSMPSASR